MNEQNTKEKLMDAARLEFSEKGFKGASLRSICHKADVTTGALYFFFLNKEDLFSQVIGNVVDEFESLMVDQSIEGRKKCNQFLCDHVKEMRMILIGAKGTDFEHVADDLKRVVENSIRTRLKIGDAQWIHVLAEMQLKAYEEVLVHDYSYERRIELMGKVDSVFQSYL